MFVIMSYDFVEFMKPFSTLIRTNVRSIGQKKEKRKNLERYDLSWCQKRIALIILYVSFQLPS